MIDILLGLAIMALAVWGYLTLKQHKALIQAVTQPHTQDLILLKASIRGQYRALDDQHQALKDIVDVLEHEQLEGRTELAHTQEGVCNLLENIVEMQSTMRDYSLAMETMNHTLTETMITEVAEITKEIERLKAKKVDIR